MYQYFGKVIAKPGKRQALIDLLSTAARELENQEKSLVYALSFGTDVDAVYVTKVWTSRQAHDAYLALDGSRAALEVARELIERVDQVLEFDRVELMIKSNATHRR